jgi:hypothetical protein
MSGCALLVALAMLGSPGDCASAADEVISAIPEKSFSLRVGQSSRIEAESLAIGVEAVSSDSRCPKGETCIWEGDATVRIWVQRAATAKETRELHTASSKSTAAEYEGWSIRLVALTPYPLTGRTITQANYVVTLELTRGPPTDSEIL